MLTLDEAFAALAADIEPVILLGNGFSQAWNPVIFDYASLLEVANFEDRENQIRELFKRLNTWDFEAVMRALLAAQTVAEVHAVEQPIIDNIKRDQEILKQALLTAISDNHPRLPSDLATAQYQSVRAFLRRFSQIFTVNYDLLMYWARNQNLEPVWRTDDGFRAQRRWEGYGTEQMVHFLHGGLHLYEGSSGALKHAYTGEVGGGIVDQVRANLDMTPPRFPLFVAEPTHQQKKQRISRSPYLTFCLRKLETNTASVFILGHSMDENDAHIFEAIRKSDTRQIFVSVFGDENSDENRRLKANALAFLGAAGKHVDFFDASTTSIWG
ncbi:DUF4917 domain-containing protein [Herminiimonas sp. KBW02]|uniref:DUF4917 family protein n=1 Tax=Herminiimonas sp. KBW02 TaxID=2153363 RepID=UPI000F5A7BEA|nr:DUF4917 family protein [Herminiimonas sp. KBW02]RQO35732.1 DUF4917 domain-containing protein [Herminiimonas sp. KBW02]